MPPTGVVIVVLSCGSSILLSVDLLLSINEVAAATWRLYSYESNKVGLIPVAQVLRGQKPLLRFHNSSARLSFCVISYQLSHLTSGPTR